MTVFDPGGINIFKIYSFSRCAVCHVYIFTHVPVCTFNTSPCMPAPRAHLLKHMCAWCQHTLGRFERTHGDVLSGHTGFFSVSHTTPHRTHTTPQHKTQHTTTHHNNTTTAPHDSRERQRQRETETDREREEKRREKIHFQCGGAWPFFVHGVLCLVKPVNARFLSLLNSVKYDSSLISFSAPWQVNSFLISAN